jgi:competence protein ComEA
VEESSGEKIININEAAAEELTVLPGIGKAKAESIVEYRESAGRFGSIEEIKNVSGIGEAVFEKIKDKIAV